MIHLYASSFADWYEPRYAYGGHDKRGLTGVYWTRPRTEPPGARFRCEILQGFTLQTEKEVDAIIREVSEEFLGSSYNLLNQNCNHFTNALCERLTSRPAPNWLNRAASIGVAFPCVVPRDWLAPPDHETAEGELLDDDTEDESSMMLQSRQLESEQHELDEADGLEGLTAPETESDSDEETGNVASDGKGRENASIRDTSGRLMPPSERAPQPTS